MSATELVNPRPQSPSRFPARPRAVSDFWTGAKLSSSTKCRERRTGALHKLELGEYEPISTVQWLKLPVLRADGTIRRGQSGWLAVKWRRPRARRRPGGGVRRDERAAQVRASPCGSPEIDARAMLVHSGRHNAAPQHLERYYRRSKPCGIVCRRVAGRRRAGDQALRRQAHAPVRDPRRGALPARAVQRQRGPAVARPHEGAAATRRAPRRCAGRGSRAASTRATAATAAPTTCCSRRRRPRSTRFLTEGPRSPRSLVKTVP